MSGQPGSLAWYLSLVTSEHNQRQNFMSTLAFLLGPICSLYSLVQSLPTTLYDLDSASGVQLDAIGQWVGVTRLVTTAITGYFTFDVGPGFDVGALYGGASAPISNQVLADVQYRTLLRAKIAENQWDGTIPGAYTASSIWCTPLGLSLLIYDYEDMTVGFVIAGAVTDLVTLGLFQGGALTLRSEGVGVRYYANQATAAKVFAFDGPLVSPSGQILSAGFDQGAFATFFTPAGAF